QDLAVTVDEDGLVGGPAARDLFRLRLAVALDHGGEEGLVVDVAGGAQTQPALPLRIAERLVRRELRRLDLACVVHDSARTHREAEPAIVGIAQGGGNIRGGLGRIDLRQQAGPRRVPQIAGVDGQQNVGWGLLAFRLQPLEELAGASGKELHLDAGLLRERFDRRFLPVVTGGIHDDFRRAGGPERTEGGNEQDQAEHAHRGLLSAPEDSRSPKSMFTRYSDLGPPKILARLIAAAALVAAMAGTAMAQSIHGTATYRERIALPPTAAFEATLEDVSRGAARAEV